MDLITAVLGLDGEVVYFTANATYASERMVSRFAQDYMCMRYEHTWPSWAQVVFAEVT